MTIEQWFPSVKLPLSWEQFRQLPQHPAYRYEYRDGEAWLSARPKSYHTLLSLERRDPPRTLRGFGRETITFRLLRESDWPQLPSLFAWSFHRVPPFSLLADQQREAAAAQCLETTHNGGDGPLIDSACIVACCDTNDGEQQLGAILVTAMPKEDREHFDDLLPPPLPPADVEACSGRPHLTWIFTNYWTARHGVGTALLGYAVNALLDLGFDELASTFLLGNESSTLWHWRNGFRLLSYPGSPRVMDRAIERTGRAISSMGRIE